MKMSQEEIESAVSVLLAPVNLSYVEHIRFSIGTDPDYLTYYQLSTTIEVRRILWDLGRGIYVHEDAEAIFILKEAMRRIPKSSAA
jgi:hypothetical protein